MVQGTVCVQYLYFDVHAESFVLGKGLGEAVVVSVLVAVVSGEATACGKSSEYNERITVLKSESEDTYGT